MEDNNEVQPTFTIDGIEIGLIKLDPVAVKQAADAVMESNDGMYIFVSCISPVALKESLDYLEDELNKINDFTANLEKKTGKKYCKFELSNGRVRAFGLKEVSEPEKKLPKKLRNGW